jgi:hypothetical protein
VRHLYGAVLAVGLTAVMFFAGGWGYLRLLRLPVNPGQAAALPAGGGSLLGNPSLLFAMAALLLAAVLAGVLAAVRRISPLAAGLPGALLLAWTALYLVSVKQAVSLIPLRTHAFGAGWEALLFHGILGLAGAGLVFPLFIPSRWVLAPRPAAGRAARRADGDLTGVWPDSAPLQGAATPPTERELADPYHDTRFPVGRPREAEPALTGRVVGGPATDGYVRPVDTTRITGASRMLRQTGSFRTSTGAVPRASGSLFDSSLLGRPRPEE